MQRIHCSKDIFASFSNWLFVYIENYKFQDKIIAIKLTEMNMFQRSKVPIPSQ